MSVDIFVKPPVVRSPAKHTGPSSNTTSVQDFGTVYSLWNGAPSAFAQVEGDSVRLTLAGGARVKLPRLPLPFDAPAPAAMAAVVDAAKAAQALALNVAQLRADATLSDVGRQQAVAGPAKAAVVAIAAAAARLGEVESALDRREAALVKAPDAPTAWADVARDAECRAWLDRQPPEVQAEAFRKALADAGGEGLVRSVLTAPYPLDPNVQRIARELWAASRKAQYPQEADAIDAERHVVEWARLSLALLAVQARQLAQTFGPSDVLDTLARAGGDKAGAAIFGFSRADADAAIVRARVESAVV